MGIKILSPDVEMVMDLAENLCDEDLVEYGCLCLKMYQRLISLQY